MPKTIAPKKVQMAIQQGFKRLENFRNARLLFLRAYMGQYYDATSGDIGTEALNLIFNAIRVLVPNIVMSFPTHHIESRFLAMKDYAELLSMALDYHGKVDNLHMTYRQAIVDAVFTLGIVKTGIAESDSTYAFDDHDKIDTGAVYTECVDFDNFVADPNSNDHLFRDAAYLGDRITIARENLLASGLYKNDLIEQMPRAGESTAARRARDLSKRNLDGNNTYDLEDEVEIVELWVPAAKAVITVPGAKDVVFDDYLRTDDFYGPDVGPYTLLALTPPVPDNPMPVPMVGVWYDLHVLANRMAMKVIDQAERQKDIMTYRRSAADDADSMRQASDGDAVAVDEGDSVKVHNFGGQQQSNEVMTSQLQSWFNMMAANPQGIGGQQLDADSATEARILQGNANIGLEDMKDAVYKWAAAESAKRAWYLHTDPFIEVPLIRRDQVPAQYAMTNQGPMMTQAPRVENRQVILTPETRRGDWLDFTYDIQPESMGRKDSQTRLREAMDFAVKVMPAAVNAAMAMFQLGIPFDVKAFIVRMARDVGIDWMDEIFFDPDFQMKMMQQMMAGPSPTTSQGQPGQAGPPPLAPGGGGLKAILQNGQPASVMANPGEAKLNRQQSQAGANTSQSELRGIGSALGPGY